MKPSRNAMCGSGRGGRTCHAAIVSREWGLPAIVGAEAAMELLKDRHVVTVSCADGETGHVYEGWLPIEIDRLAWGYSDKAEFFVDKLAQGVGIIAAAFYPKDVIVRLSDFKSNEYANLIGGRRYECSGSGWRLAAMTRALDVRS